ncbi:hypothetical protein [Sorangium cellulosum]|uniref:hypothetical protein n=1 Tax=Sorangium cellulosum TaxID=56 RepID=UPI001E650866|nr:hypothetical protein [Sorangium cellulosum]
MHLVQAHNKRTNSLSRHELYWYHAMPSMRGDRPERLLAALGRTVADHRASRDIFAAI